MKWYRAKRRAAFRRIRAAIADRLFHAKPPFIAALMDVAASVSKVSSVDFINTTPHTYHSLHEYSDLQSGQRETKVRPDIDAVFDTVEHRVHVRSLLGSLRVSRIDTVRTFYSPDPCHTSAFGGRETMCTVSCTA